MLKYNMLENEYFRNSPLQLYSASNLNKFDLE